MAYQALFTKNLGAIKLEVHQQIPSTHEYASQLINSSRAFSGQGIIAMEQTAGRGQHGRIWVDSGGALALTLVVKPYLALGAGGAGVVAGGAADHRVVATLSYVTAVAAGTVLRRLGGSGSAGGSGTAGLDLRYKWVNDILLGGRKLGGILHQLQVDEQGEVWLVVSVGLNLKQRPVTAVVGNGGAEGGGTAAIGVACLAESGVVIEPVELAELILEEWRRRHTSWLEDGFEAAGRREWLAAAAYLGQEVVLTQVTGQQDYGVFETIDKAGQLVLQDKAGGRRRVYSAGSIRAAAAL